eukprot:GHRR01003040.1.p1 GENE.GHRR01003040.1~~GHRR01003040.1.p1  ORF type:complete len:500 (+),score=140.47 GHRR01003040.1:154-1653(+)
MLGIQKLFYYFGSTTRGAPLDGLPAAAEYPLTDGKQQGQSSEGSNGSSVPAASTAKQLLSRNPVLQTQTGTLVVAANEQPIVLASSCSTSYSLAEDLPSGSDEASSISMASMANSYSRRPSLLSDSCRASRRGSLLQDSPSESLTSSFTQEGPFWASSWSFGHHSEVNQRRNMEDRISCQDLTAHPAFLGCKRAGFFAVFDGHAGHEAAEYLEKHLLSYVLSGNNEVLRSDPLAALAAAVNQAEHEILSGFADTCCNAGSTLLALLMVDDKLHIAHVGDCRAILGRGTEARQLTWDHKPACSYEQQRIQDDDPAAEISSDGYMYGELAVARAIGSAHLKRDPSKRALIPRPDLISIELQREDDFVVLATDGLWDMVDNSEAVSVARRSLATARDPEAAARALVERAQRRSSQDNISVITLMLHGRQIAMAKSNSMLFKRSQLCGLTSGNESPRCSTPASGVSTPVVATSRSGSYVVVNGSNVHPPSGPATAAGVGAQQW